MHPEALIRPAVCPACVVPTPEIKIRERVEPGDITLSLPGIHCAACISAVETLLNAEPGVHLARVNLSLRRVHVRADANVSAHGLIEALTNIGHEAHELDAALLAQSGSDTVGRELLMRLAVAGFAMMNVLLLSVAVWAGAEAATRDMMHWISAMIALPAVAFAAQPFFQNAWRSLAARSLNMDVPISLAIILASALSLFETVAHGENAYFDAALSLTFFLLAGRYLDYRTRASARSAAQELAALEVPRAIRLDGGKQTIVRIADLNVGDVIVIKPGTRLPVDGVVSSGESEIDRAFLTGESLPVFAGAGSSLHAGEINLTGLLRVEVTASATDSTLQRISRLVAVAESTRNRYTSLADRAARIYAPGVHLLALAALVGWMLLTGDVRLSLNIAISVLIITCPCALGLAVPAVTAAASGRLFRRGVLLKSATALERLAEIDTVVFDKTGTLTTGTMTLESGHKPDRKPLGIAAALAQASAHPLAKSLVLAAADAGIEPHIGVTDIREVPGYGLEAKLDGKAVKLGSAGWVGETSKGTSETWLKVGTAPAWQFAFQSEIRSGVSDLIRGFTAHGIEIHLMTGDTIPAASGVANRLGIANVHAGVLAQEKSAAISAMSDEGRKVLMVGDGLNDTASLARAHVSVSPASAIDAARVASDIILLDPDFSALLECLKTARSARARVRENFALAALYNLIAVPFALVGFATPLAAALAMSASSITVSLNSWRVR